MLQIYWKILIIYGFKTRSVEDFRSSEVQQASLPGPFLKANGKVLGTTFVRNLLVEMIRTLRSFYVRIWIKVLVLMV